MDPMSTGTSGTTSGDQPQSSPLFNSSQSSRNRVDAKEPKMGDLAQGHHGNEAWTGEQPKPDWSGLEDLNVIDFPQPKDATGHLKRTKGTFLDRAHKFKTGDDPDDPCSRLKTHFKKHGSDTVACRKNPTMHQP